MSSTAKSRERRGFLSSASRFAGDLPLNTDLPDHKSRRADDNLASMRTRQKEARTSRSRSSSRKSTESHYNEREETFLRSNLPQAAVNGNPNNHEQRNGHSVQSFLASSDRKHPQTPSTVSARVSSTRASSSRRAEPRRASSLIRSGSTLPSSAHRVVRKHGNVDDVEIAEEDELWGDIAALTSKLARMQREGASVETVRKAASEMVAARVKRNGDVLTRENQLMESGRSNDNFESEEWSSKSSRPDYSYTDKQNVHSGRIITSPKTILPNVTQAASFIDVDGFDRNYNLKQSSDYADDRSFNDDDDAESEESNAGDKGMQAAVAELTRMEVQKQMKTMFQGGEIGQLKINQGADTTTKIYLSGGSGDRGRQSPFPFSPVPLQVGATITADFGESHKKLRLVNSIASERSDKVIKDDNNGDDDDDDDSSGLTSEDEDEEADQAAKAAALLAEKALLSAHPSASTLSEGQKRMLAMTLGIKRAETWSSDTTSFQLTRQSHEIMIDANQEQKRNRRAIIASPQSVNDETDDEQESTLLPSNRGNSNGYTQPAPLQRLSSIKRKTMSSPLLSFSPSSKSVAFAISPLQSAPAPPPPPPFQPQSAIQVPSEDTILLKEEVRTLRALLERVAGQLEEQKERQNVQKKTPVKAEGIIDRKNTMDVAAVSVLSPVAPYVNNESTVLSAPLPSTSPPIDKKSPSLNSRSSPHTFQSSKRHTLSLSPSNFQQLAPPPKASAPVLPTARTSGPIYRVIADFIGDPLDGQINLSTGELLVCPNDEEHRPIEAESNGWWFAYKLIPSAVPSAQGPPHPYTPSQKQTLSKISGYVPFAYLSSTGETFIQMSAIEFSTETVKGRISTPPNSTSTPSVSSSHFNGPVIESRLTAHKAAAARARIQLSLPLSTREESDNSSISNLTSGRNGRKQSTHESPPSFTSPSSPDIHPSWNSNTGARSDTLPPSHSSALKILGRGHSIASSLSLSSSTTQVIQNATSHDSEWNNLKAAYEQLKLSAKKLDSTSEFAKTFTSTKPQSSTLRFPSSTLPSVSSFSSESNLHLGSGALSSALMTLMKPSLFSSSRQNAQQVQNSTEKLFSTTVLSTPMTQRDPGIDNERMTEPLRDALLLGAIATSFRASSLHPENKVSSFLSIEKSETSSSSSSVSPHQLRLTPSSIFPQQPPQMAFSPLHRLDTLTPSLSINSAKKIETSRHISDMEKDTKDANQLRSDDFSTLTLPPHSEILSKKPFLELSSHPAPVLDVPGSRGGGEDRLKPRRRDVNALAVRSDVSSIGLESVITSSTLRGMSGPIVTDSESLPTLRDDSEDKRMSIIVTNKPPHLSRNMEVISSPKIQDQDVDNLQIASPHYAPPNFEERIELSKQDQGQHEGSQTDSIENANSNVISPLKLGGPLPGSIVSVGMPLAELVLPRSPPPNLASIATRALHTAITAVSTTSPLLSRDGGERRLGQDKLLSLPSSQMLENVARAKEMRQMRRMRQSDSTSNFSSLHQLTQTSSFKRSKSRDEVVNDSEDEKMNEPQFEDDDNGDEETEDYMESVDLDEESRFRENTRDDNESDVFDQPSSSYVEFGEEMKELNDSSHVMLQHAHTSTQELSHPLHEKNTVEWRSTSSNNIRGSAGPLQSRGRSRLGVVAAWLGLKSRSGSKGGATETITDYDDVQPGDTASKSLDKLSSETSSADVPVQEQSLTSTKSPFKVLRETSTSAAGVGLVVPIGQEGLGRSAASRAPSSVIHVSSMLPKFVTSKDGLVNLAPQQQLSLRGAEDESKRKTLPVIIDQRPGLLLSSPQNNQLNGFQSSLVTSSSRDANSASVQSTSSFYSATPSSPRPESLRASNGAPPHLRGLRASASLTNTRMGGPKQVRTFS